LPLRWAFKLQDVITTKHLDSIGKLMLVMGWMVAYSYVVEIFIAWYSGDPFERYTYLVQRPLGPYAWVFWLMLACNVLTPQCLWWRRARTSALALFGLAGLIQIGMWTERFIIIVTSLSRDFLPSSWHIYAPTWVDWSLLAGSISFFLLLFLLFLRFVPFIPIGEVKHLRRELARGEA